MSRIRNSSYSGATTQVIQETQIIEKPQKKEFKAQIVWSNVAFVVIVHSSALYGLYLAFTSAKWLTILYGTYLYVITGLGITAGVHRLWAHKAYKAKWPLRLLLAYWNTIAFQKSVFEWSRDHRVHHKFSETDADPHNVNRGFFFAHVGWLMLRKHPEVRSKGSVIDLSDLENDPIVRFQKKYYPFLVVLCCFYIPTILPNWLWGESYWNAFFVSGMLRYCLVLNGTWLVNSGAHMWGYRPYNRFINPADNKLIHIGTVGEGYHNYHHTFPWDYSASELGYTLSLTTKFIDLMAWMGLAYDLKTVPPEIIKHRKETTGDGTVYNRRW
ncbi:stearoyl-CoA desaturase 5-like [Centruroides sculpturatus]|uniref:stearoyl-CoA desaturase 5-like n=1 Tax=Centruroides sculpturatus TaxID=218467 RepID=UPI000C6E7E57|nr:stearoyl-CoA desaturase 5-like [Centruroides sculpturatus]